MGQPPLCFDCDKEIPFDRYQLGICPECEKEREAMTKVEVKYADTLSYGAHQPNGHFCVMEAVAYISGDRWTDHPNCVSPLLGSFMRSWNDSLRTDEERVHLLAPLIPDILGTTEVGDAERSRMAWEWICRTWLPTWFDLVPSLKGHAAVLRDCPIEDILPKLVEARDGASTAWAAAWSAAGSAARAAAWAAAGAASGDAAWAAAWDAARAAAWDAAWSAAWAAAGAASGSAAWDAAWAAARAAAWAAAWAAAGTAAGAAAGTAAGAALEPTTKNLQASAQDLVRRMAAVERKPFEIKRRLVVAGVEFGVRHE